MHNNYDKRTKKLEVRLYIGEYTVLRNALFSYAYIYFNVYLLFYIYCSRHMYKV